MDEALKLLVEFVRTASPVIWEAAYRQVYVKVFNGTLGLLFFSVVYIIWLKFANWIRSEEPDGIDADVAKWVGTLVYLGVFLMIASGQINRLINPDYYAIKILLSLVNLGE